MRPGRIGLRGALALVVMAAAILGAAVVGPASGAATLRTVVVSRGQVAPSRPGFILHARRVSGPMPTRRVAARVISDEQCDPDLAGVSHCLNKIRMPNGRVLAIRHPHDMMQVPCLAPGERVWVVPGR